LRVVLAVVAIAALATASWLAIIGHRQANRASTLRQTTSAAVARNRALSNELSGLTAANSRARSRIARIDDDRRATVARMDSIVGAWNEWLAVKNGLINTANGFVDHAAELSGSEVRAALDPRLDALTAKEAALRDAVARFAAAAAKARQSTSGTKP
jgi:hypothetical protein